MQMAFKAAHPDAPLWVHVAMSAGVFVMSILMACALMKAFDEPVREWLKNHWLKGEQKLPLWVKTTGGVLIAAALAIVFVFAL